MRQRIVARSFVPTRIPNCAGWLDASQITGLADAAAVTTWSDLSGNARDVTQATAGFRPTYRTGVLAGRPVVRFDGTDDYLQSSSFTALTQPSVVFVVAIPNAASGRTVFDGIASGNRQAIFLPSGNLALYAGTQLNGPAQGSVATIMGGVFNGASSVVRQNGAATSGNANTNSMTGFTVGSRFDGLAAGCFIGDVAEVVIYNRLLNAGEIGTVERYLGRKYGIGVA